MLKHDKYSLHLPQAFVQPRRMANLCRGRWFSGQLAQSGFVRRRPANPQVMIMVDPKAPVIPGTGGLRKLRFGRRNRLVGREEDESPIRLLRRSRDRLLVAASDKREKDNFPPKYRKAYREMIDRQRQVFTTRTEKDDHETLSGGSGSANSRVIHGGSGKGEKIPNGSPVGAWSLISRPRSTARKRSKR